ncbi:MAG: class I SAM-dependent methyltransferase [candidate division Zixibacteria bacterium]|nr:class I SAM-dependent methyltransferase [candidate division Zixibacteria bacterium]
MPDDNLQEYYRARASEYEKIYYRDNRDRRQELLDEEIRLKALVSGKDVLELACGTGYWTRVMASSARSLTAVDLAPEMLVEAQRKSYDIEVSFVEASLFDRRLGGGEFDVVALGFWFSHQPRQSYDRLYEALIRPLRPGGVIWMIDNNPPAEGAVLFPESPDEHGNTFKRRYLDDGQEFVILKNYFSEQELRTLWGSRFYLKSLIHNEYYWSSVLAPKAG